MTFLLLASVHVALLAIDYLIRRAQLRYELKQASANPFLAGRTPGGDPARAPLHHLPDGYLVGEGHSWARFEPNGNLRVGSDLVPFRMLGLPEAVQLVAPGTKVKRGEPVAVLRRAGRELAIQAPVAGTVVEINREVAEQAARSGMDPFGKGWMVRIQPSRPTSVFRRLRARDNAKAWMRYELARLRDLLATLPGQPALEGATMYDGGLPVGGIADQLDEDRWTWLKANYFGDKA